MLTVKGKRKGKGGTPKPPPIFNNITKMLTNLKSVIKSDACSYKSLRDDQVKLIIKTKFI